MLNVQFFASVREAVDCAQLELALPDHVRSVRDLMHYLDEHQPGFRELSQAPTPLLVAVNQTVVDTEAPLDDGDEVAFFPPMTGG